MMRALITFAALIGICYRLKAMEPVAYQPEPEYNQLLQFFDAAPAEITQQLLQTTEKPLVYKIHNLQHYFVQKQIRQHSIQEIDTQQSQQLPQKIIVPTTLARLLPTTKTENLTKLAARCTVNPEPDNRLILEYVRTQTNKSDSDHREIYETYIKHYRLGHLVSSSDKIFCDGINTHTVFALGINQENDNHQHKAHIYYFCTSHTYQDGTNLEYLGKKTLFCLQITALTLHQSCNTIVACLYHPLNKHTYLFKSELKNTIDDLYSYTPEPNNYYRKELDIVINAGSVKLTTDIIKICALFNQYYLALSKQGRIYTLNIHTEKECEATEQRVSLLKHSIFFTDTTGEKVEDFFIHLAVDTHTQSNNHRGHIQRATEFALINTLGMLFLGSFNSAYYNAQSKVTIRRVCQQTYPNAHNLWLKKNELECYQIDVQISEQPNAPDTIITHTVQCLTQPEIYSAKEMVITE